MMTSRGWWLLIVAVFLAAMGSAISPRYGGTIAIISFTLLAWIAIEGIWFTLRLRLARPFLGIDRVIDDGRGSVSTLWAGRTVEVRVKLRLAGWVPLPFCLFEDRFPFGVEFVDGDTGGEASLRAGRTAAVRYRLRCTTPGPLRFEGVRVRCADLQGFFSCELFVRAAAVYPILPALTEAETDARSHKRHNVMPPPGSHRVRRPGTGSELLDLRDYRPGDPPKMIAWKPSARRDKLITKEFENEVPVRCTLLVDTSQSVRLGPPRRNSLTRLVTIAAAATRAALDNRDPVGLIRFDDREASHLPPARGQRHLITVLRHLGDIARLSPAAPRADADQLLPLAYAFAQEIYPDLLSGDINRFPWWIPWLFPRPEYLRKITMGDAVLPFLKQRLSRSARAREGMRKRLAALIAARENLDLGAAGLMLEDDGYLAEAMQRFLAEHQVPYPVPLYDWRGNYLFASPAKVAVAAAALLRAVRRARDNELFVILADLYELGAGLEPLLRAVRVALARHHRVVLISPWQPEIPMPGAEVIIPVDATPNELLQVITTKNLHRAFEHVRRAFGRLGVPLVNAAQGEPAQLILDRMEQLRTARIRR